MKKYKSAEEYLEWIAQELEGANHHSYVNLPENLYNSITTPGKIHTLSDEDKIELAKIIAEEFYNNI